MNLQINNKPVKTIKNKNCYEISITFYDYCKDYFWIKNEFINKDNLFLNRYFEYLQQLLNTIDTAKYPECNDFWLFTDLDINLIVLSNLNILDIDLNDIYLQIPKNSDNQYCKIIDVCIHFYNEKGQKFKVLLNNA